MNLDQLARLPADIPLALGRPKSAPKADAAYERFLDDLIFRTWKDKKPADKPAKPEPTAQNPLAQSKPNPTPAASKVPEGMVWLGAYPDDFVVGRPLGRYRIARVGGPALGKGMQFKSTWTVNQLRQRGFEYADPKFFPAQ